MSKSKASAPAAAAAKPTQVLLVVDQRNFKAAVKLYEEKQYPKALRIIEQILISNPDNGETLAMKGLLIGLIADRGDAAKRKEAMDTIRQGIMKHMNSGVVWHLQGLLYRHERMFAEAIKSYQNATKHDPENGNLLRDLAAMQAQVGLFDGYAETRRRMLVQRAGVRGNWMGYAMATYLAGNHATALTIFDSYAKSVEPAAPAAGAAASKKVNVKSRGTPEPAPAPAQNPQAAFELSELVLFQSQVMEERGDLTGALAFVTERQPDIVDTLSFHRRKAHLLERLGRLREAVAEHEWLLRTNPENYTFNAGLMRAKGILYTPGRLLSANETASLNVHFASLRKLYPKATALRRLPLDYLVDQAFEAAADAYVRPLLRAGAPSLFNDLRPLYAHGDGWKGVVLQRLMESYLTNLRSNASFGAPAGAAGSADGAAVAPVSDDESPSCELWVSTYLAHHHDFMGRPQQALQLVEESLAHSPTLIDLHMLRAGVLKHAGNSYAAHASMETARAMDTADRFLNTHCVSYALQANRPRVAEATVALFLKEDSVRLSMYDMQVSWYGTQLGACMQRLGQDARALKALLGVHDHFETYLEDQFDYHSYCLRKGTLRAYAEMVRWGESLRAHRFYVRAVSGAVEVLLGMHFKRQAELYSIDTVIAAKEQLHVSELDSLASPAADTVVAARAEARAALKSQKDEKAAAAEKEHERLVAAFEETRDKSNVREPRGEGVVNDHNPEVDPLGHNLASLTDPLANAARYVQLLLSAPSSKVSAVTHLLAFEVYLAKGKLVLALKSLKAAASALAHAPIVATPLSTIAAPGQANEALPIDSYPYFPRWMCGEGAAGVQRVVLRDMLRAYVTECSLRLSLEVTRDATARHPAAQAVFDAERAKGAAGMLPAASRAEVIAQARILATVAPAAIASSSAAAAAKAATSSTLPSRLAAASVLISAAKYEADAPLFVRTDRANAGFEWLAQASAANGEQAPAKAAITTACDEVVALLDAPSAAYARPTARAALALLEALAQVPVEQRGLESHINGEAGVTFPGEAPPAAAAASAEENKDAAPAGPSVHVPADYSAAVNPEATTLAAAVAFRTAAAAAFPFDTAFMTTSARFQAIADSLVQPPLQEKPPKKA